ncbi:MAG TPA: MoaD/ThiS family protein [Acidimicrobiales bacterium]|nr:MoaD/ThiS family protein [Acidimicrobiales bacterium]
MHVRVRVPTPLRELVGGARTVEIAVAPPPAGDGTVTVAAVLDAIATEHPALERRVRDEQGRTRVHVNLFVGADNVRDRGGLTTPIGPGEELSIIPAISGG